MMCPAGGGVPASAHALRIGDSGYAGGLVTLRSSAPLRTSFARVTFAVLMAAGGLTALSEPRQTAGGQNASPPLLVQTGRGGGVCPHTQPDAPHGFVPIFDGKSLAGWDGDTTFWRAENGEIIGETTPEKVVKLNNFLIWRGGTVRDFELKVEFRMNGTNSGIQYRSTELPAPG